MEKMKRGDNIFHLSKMRYPYKEKEKQKVDFYLSGACWLL